MMTLLCFVTSAFELCYGLYGLSMISLVTILTGEMFRRAKPHEREELADARNNLWSLNKQPFGLKHQFCTLNHGLRLHYVIREPTNKPRHSNIVIFIHGFPDSWAVWKHQLTSEMLYDATLIAVDVPGSGGSDGLDRYNATSVLEAVSQFIVKMRDIYLRNTSGDNRDGQVIVVAHDWGAIIAFRLASEAPQLADRFIMTNSIHPSLTLSNVISRVASAKLMLKTWTRSPRSISLLRKAFANLLPILSQILKSWYIFVFRLPMPLAASVGCIGDFSFFRFLSATAHSQKSPRIPGPKGAEALAETVGPGEAECVVVEGGHPTHTYGPDVKARARTGGWATRIRLYREGLFSGPWEKSLETMWKLEQLEEARTRSSSAGGSCGGLFNTGPVGALMQSSTVVWGMEDPALDSRLNLEGMGDYMSAKGSQVVQVKGVGHWTPIEEGCREVLVEVVAWAVGGEKRGKLSEVLSSKSRMDHVKVAIEK
ncbi:putative alpha/beta hydrolase [Eremomyces bilateralis CBS 781.70]|uniref:Alpha/beta hydrolase n=1 Tax=Eremomyces bilateralis CBS 781.70 TaxID=1392243 RepID=A0A6G1GDF0_9PEZI|nr:putative alpha/beta hydrolase [Eremomyces bilateralis CBS 781.70]KAF1816068.1 putative alpha/beta hydrolase [Eremomyces bilateralis CBS 781.70]